MKLFVVGKLGSITHWLEDAVEAWRADGHAVRLGVARNPALNPTIERLMLARPLGAPMAARMARAITGFGPDLVIAVGGYHVPPALLERIAALPGRPPLVGWVGDLFFEAARDAAALYDLVAYTDSGLADLHGRLGFAGEALYLPHAVNPHVQVERRPREVGGPAMVFVANPTAHRRDVVGRITAPISLYGPGWTPVPGVDHAIHAYRVQPGDLMSLYASHDAALNIRNEHNVLFGLNQRNFDPYLAGAAVVTDHQADLERCFDLGDEVLAYGDTDELNAIHARLLAAPGHAAQIGERGRRRVLADHTYGRRLEALRRHL